MSTPRLLLALLFAAAPLRAGVVRAPVAVPSAGLRAGVVALAAPAPSMTAGLVLAAPAPSLAPSASPALAPAEAPRAVDAAAGLAAAPAAPADAPAESLAALGAAAFDAAVERPESDAVAADASASGGLAEAFEKAFAENPEQAAQVEARVRSSSYGRLLGSADWKPEFARAFAPWLGLRARQEGGTLASYARFAASDSAEARAERAGLMTLLSKHTGHRAEDWTYLFRDRPLWRDGLDRFLDETIAARRASGARRLDLRSVGAAYGSEAYTLAITVDRALRRAGEDPEAWAVSIPAYDVSLLSLLTAGRGLYRLGPRDARAFAESGAEAYFEPGPAEGLFTLKPALARWVKPVYADLNDERQHPLVTEARPDVVFANYLLFHLRAVPAGKLANHWLSGKWARRGFLSMAQVVVAEVGESPREPAKMEKPLFDQFDGNVGAAGRMFYGDTFGAPGGARHLWREWRRGKTARGKAVRAATRAFSRDLYRDAFHAAPVDAAALALLEDVSRRYGLEVRLTNEDVLVQWHPDEGRLYAGLGWLTGGGLAEALSRWLAQELEGVRESPAPAARVEAWTLQGAPLALATEGGRVVVRWLERNLTVVSDAFRGDNADKSEEQLKQEAPAPGSGAPRGVRGLY